MLDWKIRRKYMREKKRFCILCSECKFIPIDKKNKFLGLKIEEVTHEDVNELQKINYLYGVSGWNACERKPVKKVTGFNKYLDFRGHKNKDSDSKDKDKHAADLDENLVAPSSAAEFCDNFDMLVGGYRDEW